MSTNKEVQAERPDTAEEVLAKLRRVEATTGDSGAVPNTPKSHMLDVSQLQKDNPQYRYRFANLKDQSKVERRQNDGYEVVPTAEGGKRLGSELVLMRQPQDLYLRKQKSLKQKHDRLLNSHVEEMEQVAESVAKVLRDRYGIQISRDRILVQEAS